MPNLLFDKGQPSRFVVTVCSECFAVIFFFFEREKEKHFIRRDSRVKSPEPSSAVSSPCWVSAGRWLTFLRNVWGERRKLCLDLSFMPVSSLDCFHKSLIQTLLRKTCPSVLCLNWMTWFTFYIYLSQILICLKSFSISLYFFLFLYIYRPFLSVVEYKIGICVIYCS